MTVDFVIGFMSNSTTKACSLEGIDIDDEDLVEVSNKIAIDVENVNVHRVRKRILPRGGHRLRWRREGKDGDNQ